MSRCRWKAESRRARISNTRATGHAASSYSPSRFPAGGTRRRSRAEPKSTGRVASDGCLTGNIPRLKKIVLATDNLNAHSLSSLYEAFPPEGAFRLARRLGQRRIPDLETMNSELAAWRARRNRSQKGVDWQLTAADAASGLKDFTR